MVDENSKDSILEYLQRNGATNTFKLANVLDIKRDKLLGILKNLEEQGAVKIVTGKVEFLSYPPSKEKKKQKPKVSKEKSEIQTLQEKVEKLKLHIKKLQQKPAKIIRKVIIKEKEAKAKPEAKTKIPEVRPLKISKPIKRKKRKREKIKLVKPPKLFKFKIKTLRFNIKKFIKHLKKIKRR